MRTNVGHVDVAGDVSGKLPLSSVASMQGRKIAERVMGLHKVDHRHHDYDKAASAIFADPEIADVGLAEADALAEGRKVRVAKVPFAGSAKAQINNDPRGLVKTISDPATRRRARRLDIRVQRVRTDRHDRGGGDQRPAGERHRRVHNRASGPQQSAHRGG